METRIPAIEDRQKPAPRKKPWWRFLLNVVVYFGILFGTIFGLPKFLAWKLETPYPMAAITSGSMWPALKEGDLVFIHGVHTIADLKVGDVIVYRNKVNNTLTIHRVKTLDAEKDVIVTKGDANFAEDTPTNFASVVGSTVQLFGGNLRIPYLGIITVTAGKFANQNK